MSKRIPNKSRRRSFRRLLVIVVAAVLPQLVNACLFSPRDDSPPGGGGTDVVALTSPERVFEALRVSMTNQSPANYENALSDQFIFSPLLEDSLDPSLPPGIYNNWTKSVELSVRDQLFGDSRAIDVSFSPSRDIDQVDFVRFRTEYDLIVVSVVVGDTSRYRGVSHFDVRNEGGNWRIELWRDIEKIEDFTTWGFLRGVIRQRVGS